MPKFPQHVQDLARKKMMADYKPTQLSNIKGPKISILLHAVKVEALTRIGRQPNKTEMQCWSLLEATGQYSRIVYEGITLRLRNGHKYTADLVCISKAEPIEAVKKPNSDEFMVTTISRPITLVEVKNAAYKHASYGRSKMAFDQAKIDWPEFSYIWMEKGKDKVWRTT